MNTETSDHSFRLFLENAAEIFHKITEDSDISEPLGKLLFSAVEFFEALDGSIYLVMNRKLALVSSINENLIQEIELSEADEKKLAASDSVIEEGDISYFPSLGMLISRSIPVKLLIPLTRNNDFIGFITLGRKLKGNYDKTDKLFLTMLAATLSGLIFKSHSYIKMSGKSSDEIYLKNILDPLAEVYIRSYIEQRMSEGVKEAIRYKKPYSLSVVSIDNFETLRKQFGQQAINTLLQQTGKIIRNLLRQDVDLAGKLDEGSFLLLLPSTERKGAIIFSERLKGRLGRLNLEKYPELPVTASVGVTSLEQGDKNREELLHKGLQALEYSQKLGGNTLSYNYEGLISENLSDFEKATGMSAKLVKNNLENPYFLTDEFGNEIDFTRQASNKNWINIPKKH